MKREFFNQSLLDRLTGVSAASVVPIPVIISFVSDEKSTEFASAAESGSVLLDHVPLRTDELSEPVRAAVADAAAEEMPRPELHSSIKAVSVALPAGLLMALSDRGEGLGIRRAGIEADFQVRTALDHVRPITGASRVQAAGTTGSGVLTAVLDTGIDANHADLSGRIAGAKDFTGEGLIDENGHGTHVAGIVAGEGRLLGGKYRGIAPGARLLNVKVLDREGGSNASRVISGIEWAVAQKAHVLNLSVEGPPTDGTDALSRAADWAVDQGAVVCAAAGNQGAGPNTVTSPGAARKAITVGATVADRDVAVYSSRGSEGSGKPTIVLPGTVTSCLSADAEIPNTIDDLYWTDTGTSMAAPQATGFCALLLEQDASLTSAALRDLLVRTAVDLDAPPEAQGAGRGNVADAIEILRNGTIPPEPIEEIAIVGVVAELGLTPSSIGRVRIALTNRGEQSATSCTSELAVDTPGVTVLAARGDYGTLDPGETDDAPYLVEYARVDGDAVPFQLRVTFREGDRSHQLTLEDTLPVRALL